MRTVTREAGRSTTGSVSARPNTTGPMMQGDKIAARSRSRLEEQLPRELNLPFRTARAGDLTELSTVENFSWYSPYRMVWRIEHVGSKLKAPLLADRKVANE